MDVVAHLYEDLFAGLPGELFLAAMAALFVAAIVSGIVFYGRFMRRLTFGTVRRARPTHIKWLDLHNLLGGAALAWTLVVGVTGELASVQAAFDTVRQALPGTMVVSGVYPCGEFGTVPASAALPEAAAE